MMIIDRPGRDMTQLRQSFAEAMQIIRSALQPGALQQAFREAFAIIRSACAECRHMDRK